MKASLKGSLKAEDVRGTCKIDHYDDGKFQHKRAPGHPVEGSHKYMHVFVRIISAKRRFAQLNGNTDLVKDIDLLLRDLILVQHNVPTDDEILHFGQKA